MSCDPELVSAFLDGELDEIILPAVTGHLVGCDACRRLLSRLVRVRDLIAEPFDLPDPEAATVAIMRAVGPFLATAASQVTPHSALQRALLRYGLPGALAAMAMAGWLQQRLSTQQSATDSWQEFGRRGATSVTVDRPAEGVPTALPVVPGGGNVKANKTVEELPR